MYSLSRVLVYLSVEEDLAVGAECIGVGSLGGGGSLAYPFNCLPLSSATLVSLVLATLRFITSLFGTLSTPTSARARPRGFSLLT